MPSPKFDVMSVAPHLHLVPVDRYLADELKSSTRHEYLGGVVYAMPGGRNRHNRIATNILVALGRRLDGHPCEPFNSDTKIRLRLPNHVRFYYPDASVVCRPNPADDTFQDEPKVVVEVLSRSTRRIDEGEKREAYLSIASLNAYLLVEQEVPAVIVYRRTDQGFAREVHEGVEVSIPLPELNFDIPASEIYRGVTFGSEADDT